ncbi:MAG: hypothetical protein ACXAAO_12210 [Candidatus Thorarchaeota archaeon]|jgi:hypothetical protein
MPQKSEGEEEETPSSATEPSDDIRERRMRVYSLFFWIILLLICWVIMDTNLLNIDLYSIFEELTFFVFYLPLFCLVGLSLYKIIGIGLRSRWKTIEPTKREITIMVTILIVLLLPVFMVLGLIFEMFYGLFSPVLLILLLIISVALYVSIILMFLENKRKDDHTELSVEEAEIRINQKPENHENHDEDDYI